MIRRKPRIPFLLGRIVRRSARRMARVRRRLAKRSRGAWLGLRMVARPPARVRGVRLAVARSVTPEMRRAIYTGRYVHPEIALVDAHLEPGDRVMELGGGLGVVSAFCAKRVGSENVVTYEANPALEARALDTYRRNAVQPEFVCALVGPKEGVETFYVHASTWSSSVLPSDAATPIRVPVRAFDRELARVQPSFVVMDVEGAELELVSATDWRGVRKLMLELHPSLLGETGVAAVRAALAEAGFSCREEVGDCLYLTREPTSRPGARWSFDVIAPVFEDHIARSLPHYREGHQLVCRLAEPFLRDDSLVYDLGTATGALPRALLAGQPDRSRLRCIGVDASPAMIEEARRLGAGDSRACYRVADLVQLELEPCSLVVSYYTLQFVPRSARAPVLDRIQRALEPGGALLLFEKVRLPGERLKAVAAQLHHDLKRGNGFSEAEIRAKEESLRGVMESLTARENETLLAEAGFREVSSVYQWLCFQGWLAVK